MFAKDEKVVPSPIHPTASETGVQTVLSRLQQQVRVDSPLTAQLKTSLVEHQVRQLGTETGEEVEGNVYIFNDRGSQLEKETGIGAYKRRVVALRKKMPVLGIDLKTRPASDSVNWGIVDLKETITTSISSGAKPTKDSQGLFPLHQVKPRAGGYIGFQTAVQAIGEISDVHYKEGLETGVAIEYPDHLNRDAETVVYEFVEPSNESAYEMKRNLAILIPQTAMDECNGGYGSPWLSKVSFSQMKALSTGKIVEVMRAFYRALDPRETSKVRFVDAGYGSGKSFAARKLEQAASGDIGYIDGINPLGGQEDKLQKPVIIVDEPVVMKREDLQRISKSGKVVVMLVPNAEVRQKVEEALK